MKKVSIVLVILISIVAGIRIAHAFSVSMVDANDFVVTDDLNSSVEYTMSQINSYVVQSKSVLTNIGRQQQTADETYASWYQVQQQALNEIGNAEN